ncbi:MAG: response regulator [Proteobacteria bacterium]|nr:response regulator [Pseudomonadota bacterium]
MTGKIGVLVIDPDGDIRHWMERLLNRTDNFTCLGAAASVLELSGDADRIRPAMILVDAQSTSLPGSDLIRHLRGVYPAAKVVIMEIEEGGRYENLARRIGADAYISKSSVPESLDDLKRRLFMQGGIE